MNKVTAAILTAAFAAAPFAAAADFGHEQDLTIDGKPVRTKINSTFTRFYTAKPTSSAPFKADARFFAK